MNTILCKDSYERPFIQLKEVYVEHSLASGSALIKPGDNENEDVPDVEDWFESGESGTSHEF